MESTPPLHVRKRRYALIARRPAEVLKSNALELEEQQHLPTTTRIRPTYKSKKRKYANGADCRPSKAVKSNLVDLKCKDDLATITSNTSTPFTSKHSMLTRGITTTTTRNAVFNTMELLEDILLHLSAEDIITVRQVNRHWNAVISTSPRLQRTLFLGAAPTHGFWVFDTALEQVRKYNGGDHLRFGRQWAERQNIITPAQVNPLLFRNNASHLKGSLVQRAQFCESIKLQRCPDLSNVNSLYHKMFVCLPPVRAVEFELHYYEGTPRGRISRYYGQDYVHARVENDRGVTFGDVIQKFMAEAGMNANIQASKDLTICVGPSMIWMLGVIFPTEKECQTVENGSTLARL